MAVFIHLALFFPVAQAVVVLHADKLGPPVSLSGELHLGELVGPHGAGTNVADFARLDEVMQCFHCFLDRDGGVEAVDLEEVDVVRSESLQGCIDCVEDCDSG